MFWYKIKRGENREFSCQSRALSTEWCFLSFQLYSSTKEELKEWCRATSNLSRVRRVPMTTLCAAITRPCPPRCSEGNGPRTEWRRDPDPPNLPCPRSIARRKVETKAGYITMPSTTNVGLTRNSKIVPSLAALTWTEPVQRTKA